MGRLLKGLSKAVEDTASDKAPGVVTALFANKNKHTQKTKSQLNSIYNA